MQLTVKGKQIDVGDALRSYVSEALETVAAKYFNDPIEASVIFSREAHLFRASIAVHVGRGLQVQGQADADDIYAAFNLANERVGKRLRRNKRRLRDHRREDGGAPLPPLPAQAYILRGPIDGPDDTVGDEGDDDTGDTADGNAPLVIAEMQTDVPSLTVQAAVLRLDLSEEPALLFRNSAHGGINLVYRRSDGNLGWIDPESAEKA